MKGQSQPNRIGPWVASALAICLPAIPQLSLAEASAHGASGRWFVKKAASGSDSVWFGSFTWAKTATINWKLPTFSADGAALPTAPVPFAEPKFTIVGGFPAARVFAGYSLTGTGTKGSTATSTGSGSSSVGLVFYGADWTVTASGTGTYDVLAKADDPWNILPSDLSSITGSTYSVYIPFSMLAGQSDVSGGKTGSGFGYDVTYTTADGTETLLDVAVNGKTGVATASSAFGSNLKFYLEPNSTTAPVDAGTPGAQINASELQGLLSGDIGSDGSLSLPINLGIVLSGIPIPTQTFGADGAVAQIGVGINAHESAVPEPCTILVLGAGAAAVICRRRRKASPPS